MFSYLVPKRSGEWSRNILHFLVLKYFSFSAVFHNISTDGNPCADAATRDDEDAHANRQVCI